MPKLSEDSVAYHEAFTAQRSEDMRAEIRADLETLDKHVRAAISTNDYNPTILALTLKIHEKDAELRMLDKILLNLRAAIKKRDQKAQSA